MDIAKYMFIPKHIDGFELRTRIFNTNDIDEDPYLDLEKIQEALESGTTLKYKGNDYFVDFV